MHQQQLATLPVNFLLYTAASLTDYETIGFDGEQVNFEEGTRFDPGKLSKVVVHGWGGGLHLDEYLNSAYMEAGLDYNILGVDWREMEGPAKTQVDEVGIYTAHFLEALKEFGLDLGDVHAIGFSYGAHVVASLGREVIGRGLKRLPRITCLDPGVIGFGNHPELVIKPEDADYVDIIHTDSDHMSFLEPLGHADFYPNGGLNQLCSCSNKCDDIPCDNSDHKRAPVYYRESILSRGSFPSWQCTQGWDAFLEANMTCPYDASGALVSMGEWSLESSGWNGDTNSKLGNLESLESSGWKFDSNSKLGNFASKIPGEAEPRGVYYLHTRRESPFSCEEINCFVP